MPEISDGYGVETPEFEDQLLFDAQGWMSRVARALTAHSPEKYDDVRQEGQIELWQRFREYADLGPEERISHSMQAARFRMRNVASREVRLVGQASRQGHALPPVAFSMDEEWAVDSVVLAVSTLEGVEVAYHRGEILAALNGLTERQRRYVYARFWCGMDPVGGLHSNPGMKQARANNPYLRRDVLWTGNKTSKGAKRSLAEALAHLAEVGS